tara:strand:+ start:463 stop:1389 length:927 start_codon:yes stop_codon:yes gene_type:complete
MAIAIIIQEPKLRDKWLENFRSLAPDLDFRVWPDLGQLSDITFAITWRPPHNVFENLPNLKAIHSIGAGVNYIFETPNLPHVAILKVVDERLTHDMAQYVSHAVLNHFLKISRYQKAQLKSQWSPSRPLPQETQIGILGLGEIGAHTAQTLRKLHFNVCGYSQSPKPHLDFQTYHGKENFDLFLHQTDILVCLLPLTAQTENILNYDLFYKLRKNAYIINVGRGKHLVENDLIRAIDEQQLSGASLDVFKTEPLPSEHPFWKHEQIHITPHIASQTVPARVCKLILDNYQRQLQDLPYLNQVNQSKGY